MTTQSTSTNPTRRIARTVVLAALLVALGAGSYISWTATAGTPGRTDDVVEAPAPVAAASTANIDSLYTAKANEPTEVETTSAMPVAPERVLAGRVSWYGPGFHGRRTASGERFDQNALTCAHKSLPFGSIIRVTNTSSNRSVLVRVNDRGPYCGGRIIDLSSEAARRIGIKGSGTGSTHCEVFTPAHLKGNALSFDADARAVTLRGYSVTLKITSSFDEAAALQARLVEQGVERPIITRVTESGKTLWRVSSGLYATESLCSSLLAELVSEWPNASVDHIGGSGLKSTKGSLAHDSAAAPVAGRPQ